MSLIFRVLAVATLCGLMSISFAQAPAAPTVPCSSTDHQGFDFWVGEWRVTLADGSHAGDNTISKVQGGCVLQESWRSATSAYTGTSYNAFNQAAGTWEQLWLDNQGGRLHLKGNRQGEQMILASEPAPNAQGQASYNQITWTKNTDGTVRQHWLIVTEGADDQVAFDGIYTKVDAE